MHRIVRAALGFLTTAGLSLFLLGQTSVPTTYYVSQSEQASNPWRIYWNTTTVTNGLHVITATARDAAGNTTTAAPITVNVNNETPRPPGPILGTEVVCTGELGAEGKINLTCVPSTQ